MLKVLSYLVILIIVGIGLATALHLYRVSQKNKNEMSKFSQKLNYENNLGKVLVVYYSLSGHTKEIADEIVKVTNADVYRIETTEELKQNSKLHLKVRDQLKSEKYPEIKQDFPNFHEYDVIFIGGPVWWYRAATPLLSFMEKADLSGKKIVPFSTQGSNPGKFEQDVKEKMKGAKILTYEKFNNLSEKYDEAVENKIVNWLNNL